MTAKLFLGLAMLTAVAAAAAWFYRQGGESVRTTIERQNNAAGDASDQARSDYDRCVPPIGSGVYDFATGKCLRAAPRGRH
jgi:hypothetical protein